MIKSDFEYFVIPDLPDHIEIAKEQLLRGMHDGISYSYFGQQVTVVKMVTYGVIINSFKEIESAYVQDYEKMRGGKVWCISPVQLCNKDSLDMGERGNNKALIHESECMNFLDSQKHILSRSSKDKGDSFLSSVSTTRNGK